MEKQEKNKAYHWNTSDIEKAIADYAIIYQTPIPEISKKTLDNYIGTLINQVENQEEAIRLSELWKINKEIGYGNNLERILNIMKIFNFNGKDKKPLTKIEEKILRTYIHRIIPPEMKKMYFDLLEMYIKKNGHKKNE